jgi:hypothetical protein
MMRMEDECGWISASNHVEGELKERPKHVVETRDIKCKYNKCECFKHGDI